MRVSRRTIRCLLLAISLAVQPWPAFADDAETCAKESGETALAACDRAIASGTIRGAELAKLYYYRGFEWAQKQEFDRTIDDLEESLRIDPTQARVFMSLGHAYRATGDLDRAIANYTDAIAHSEDDPNAFYFRAGALREKGEFHQAISDYDTAIALDPEEAEFYNARGIASAANGELDLAIDDYTIAVELAPELAPAYANRGDAQLLLGNLDEAIADYGNAIAQDPDDVIAIYKRGNAYRAQGSYDAGIADYDQVVSLAADVADGYYERAVTHILKREFDAAISDLDQAVLKEPAFVLAYNARGIAQAAKGDFEAAIADYSEAILLDPDNAERLVMRAWTSFLMEKFDLALVDAERAVELDPDLISAYATRAKILEALGETEEARLDGIEEEAARGRRDDRRAAEADAKSAAARRRHELRAEAEQAFLSAYDKQHPYVYPVERSAAALGYRFDDDTIVKYSDTLAEDGRTALASFQKSKHVRATGYLDEPTFQKLLAEPVIPEYFKIEQPWNVAPEPIGDWFFSGDVDWCTIWTKPLEIRGIFNPDFTELPLVTISRNREGDGDSLSQTYAEGDLYEEDAEVSIHGDRTLETERFGSDFGPVSTCSSTGCGASSDVLKELRAVNEFEVIGPSKFGGELTIVYSAVGFTKSFQRLNQECGNGRLANWLR